MTATDQRQGMPIIVSFYTKATPYEALAERLRASCDRLGLAHDVVAIDSLGSWEVNNAAKARICRAAWQRLRQPILWVDADAIIRARPVLVCGVSEDFAVHKWKDRYFAGGTILFNQTALAGQLLDGWVDRCATDLGVLDQVHLERQWAALPRLRTLWLPRAYCQIFDARRDEPPVIEHFQASRLNRHKPQPLEKVL